MKPVAPVRATREFMAALGRSSAWMVPPQYIAFGLPRRMEARGDPLSVRPSARAVPSIDSGNQPRGPRAVGFVRAAELAAQQRLLRADAREQWRNRQCDKQHADPRAECQCPAQRADLQSKITGMANDAIDPSRDQRMPGLDGDQSAETMAEHEDRPDAQRAADDEQYHAGPANGVSVDRPELDAVGVGRQIAAQQPEQPDGDEDPAVAAILPLAGAEVAAAEQRDDGQQACCYGKNGQRRMGEKRGEPSPAEDGEPEIAKGRDDGDECQLRFNPHGGPRGPSGTARCSPSS